MFAQFLDIVFKSLKLDKTLYRTPKYYGEVEFSFPTKLMTKGFLIVICITIAIALIVFPLIISYKAQKSKKKKN